MARDLDWTKTGTVEGMAEWLRSRSDALAVVVVRVNDAVLAADSELATRDVGEVVADRLPGLLNGLQIAREHKRKAGRVELNPVRE